MLRREGSVGAEGGRQLVSKQVSFRLDYLGRNPTWFYFTNVGSKGRGKWGRGKGRGLFWDFSPLSLVSQCLGIMIVGNIEGCVYARTKLNTYKCFSLLDSYKPLMEEPHHPILQMKRQGAEMVCHFSKARTKPQDEASRCNAKQTLYCLAPAHSPPAPTLVAGRSFLVQSSPPQEQRTCF